MVLAKHFDYIQWPYQLFLKTNPWFNDWFKFLMWKTYSVLLCKLARSLSKFSIFSLSGKMVNHCYVHVLFQDIEHQLHKNFLHQFTRYSLL